MKKIINPHTTLLALGILQPASKFEVVNFLIKVLEDVGTLPPADDFGAFFELQISEGRVLRVKEEGEPYYSLTLAGSLYLPPEMRKIRDKFRAYLLRDSHRGRFFESREIDNGSAGVSPALDTRSGIKGRAANKLGRTAEGRRSASGRPYWPRIPGQVIPRSGRTRSSRDTFLPLLSFADQTQAGTALGKAFSFDYVGIGICLGLSPQLIWNISHQQHIHYRSFNIPKRGGGERAIESPRIFLKSIQWFLMDFVLNDLVCHDAVHSFSIGRSIVTNAEKHVGRKFVANVDIENFFGSITAEMVVRHLNENGFTDFEAVVISKLCTYGGVLPQGAPTSPTISNSVLYDFDVIMDRYCRNHNITYSRYADDISMSGDDVNAIAIAVDLAQAGLIDRGLRLNSKKTRVATRQSQQNVTGVVVNTAARPPRKFRRNARAAFHRASLSPEDRGWQLAELRGTLGFLAMFPMLAQSNEVQSYREVLRSVENAQAD